MRRLCALAVAAAGLLAANAAFAADEEIQVYQNVMNKPGHFGLDVHNSWVVSGEPLTDYAGQQQSLHRVRITPEFSYGLTEHIELGAYLPLTTIQDGEFDVGGVKGRIKYLAPQPEGQSWYWGLNFELGRVERQLDVNPWNAEAKIIVGGEAGRWTWATNANIGFVVDGPDDGPAELEIATKLTYALNESVAVGIENYNGVGNFDHIGDLNQQDQSVYATIDTSRGDWGLNFGVGRGYGSNPDKWTLKAILTVPIDPRK